MIIQINYNTNIYDEYFKYNQKYKELNLCIYDNTKIDSFLKEYNYYDIFYNYKIPPEYEYASKAILCDALRLMIIYEKGGIYIDSDVYFNNNIYNLESNLEQEFGDRTLMLSTKSLFFFRAKKHSPYIKHLLDKYLNQKYLKIDIYMVGGFNLKKYSNELMFLSEDYLTRHYFDHIQITTSKKNIKALI